MAVTQSGWPYVEPTDFVIDYPATSLALASLLETRWGLITICAGLFDATGTIVEGSGFTVTKMGTGNFMVDASASLSHLLAAVPAMQGPNNFCTRIGPSPTAAAVNIIVFNPATSTATDPGAIHIILIGEGV